MKIKPEVIGFIGLAAIVGVAIGKGIRSAAQDEKATDSADDGTTSDYCGYSPGKLPEIIEYDNYSGRTPLHWPKADEGYLGYTRRPPVYTQKQNCLRQCRTKDGWLVYNHCKTKGTPTACISGKGPFDAIKLSTL